MLGVSSHLQQTWVLKSKGFGKCMTYKEFKNDAMAEDTFFVFLGFSTCPLLTFFFLFLLLLITEVVLGAGGAGGNRLIIDFSVALAEGLGRFLVLRLETMLTPFWMELGLRTSNTLRTCLLVQSEVGVEGVGFLADLTAVGLSPAKSSRFLLFFFLFFSGCDGDSSTGSGGLTGFSVGTLLMPRQTSHFRDWNKDRFRITHAQVIASYQIRVRGNPKPDKKIR